MSTNPDALKNVYVALGGDMADVNNINKNPEMIDKVAEQIRAGGSGSSLPPYTSADKGKVLGIAEKEPQTVVVIPEQSTTFVERDRMPFAPLSNVNLQNLPDKIPVTISDTGSGLDGNYVAEYDSGDGWYVLAPGFAIADVDGWGVLAFNLGAVGITFTISATASVPEVEPKWEESGGGTFKFLVNETTPRQVSEAIANGQIVIYTDYNSTLNQYESAYMVFHGVIADPEFWQINFITYKNGSVRLIQLAADGADTAYNFGEG